MNNEQAPLSAEEAVEKIQALKEFARVVLTDCWHGSIEGYDLEIKAEELGLIEPVVVSEHHLDNDIVDGEKFELGDTALLMCEWLKAKDTSLLAAVRATQPAPAEPSELERAAHEIIAEHPGWTKTYLGSDAAEAFKNGVAKCGEAIAERLRSAMSIESAPAVSVEGAQKHFKETDATRAATKELNRRFNALRLEVHGSIVDDLEAAEDRKTMAILTEADVQIRAAITAAKQEAEQRYIARVYDPDNNSEDCVFCAHYHHTWHAQQVPMCPLCQLESDRELVGNERQQWQERERVLEKSLEWAISELDDELGVSDENKAPEHNCELFSNPMKGACSFCENYWDARAALATSAPESTSAPKEK